MQGRICCCGDLQTRNILIKVLEATTGIAPTGKGNTSSVKRAYYDEVPTRMIVMVFVVVPALRGFALLYWPKNPDPEAVRKFQASGEFGPWTANDGVIN